MRFTVGARAILPAMFLVLGLAAMNPASALAVDLEYNYSWDAPTSGSAVEKYVVEIEFGQSWILLGEVTTNAVDVTVPEGGSHSIRVAGVDAFGRQGPFSVASDRQTDLGSPTEPSAPSLISVALAGFGLLMLALFGRMVAGKKEDKE
jgi:hypothetical protein